MCFFARMSGILSSLNKSGQFMSDEKKKGGFWSWFGLGKNKQEASTEPKEPESKEQLPNESEVQETAEKTTALCLLLASVSVFHNPIFLQFPLTFFNIIAFVVLFFPFC